jgi:predicted DNA-binding ribbon-helix-helix protein
MKSPIVKRSVALAGHKTSVSLEEAFWEALKEIAALHDSSAQDLVALIDKDREQGNLSSAVRLFVLEHYRKLQPKEVASRSEGDFLICASGS